MCLWRNLKKKNLLREHFFIFVKCLSKGILHSLIATFNIRYKDHVMLFKLKKVIIFKVCKFNKVWKQPIDEIKNVSLKITYAKESEK